MMNKRQCIVMRGLLLFSIVLGVSKSVQSSPVAEIILSACMWWIYDSFKCVGSKTSSSGLPLR